ncbi:MAG TPA: vWA domain-containing protein [Candidatus Binataceae bacterium]|nr:vWA domain-containing protein [Candidatus Binataceae bacterium]
MLTSIQESISLPVIIIAVAISTIVLAFILYWVFSRRRRAAGAAETEGRLSTVKGALHFLLGPFPLSIAIHVIALLLLIAYVHPPRGRELIMVNLEAGGGGGGGGEEMQQMDMPEVPLPDSAPIQNTERPVTAETSQAVGMAENYVRAAGGGGIGIGRGGGIGSGYGRGVGAGFGGFIGNLRRSGLDVVLVIDGTGSMKLILEDVKAKMSDLIRAIHRLVPIARIGVIIYGGTGEPLDIQPLTISADKVQAFLENMRAKGGGTWEENMLGAIQTAVDRMDYKPYAKKVIVLVGDSPPAKNDFDPIMTLIRQFRANNGTFNTVDVTEEEHERFERDFWEKVHQREPPYITPLPAFYQQTRSAFKIMSTVGGGAMRSLSKDVHINQQVLILAFGEQWQTQVSAFGRGIGK